MITLATIKGCLKSWTIWMNSIFASLLAGLPMLQDSLPQLQAYVPDHAFRYIGAAVVVANILLRFKTNSSLDKK